MARRGFWDSFYQGFEQGDKIVERNRGLKQRADIKKAYSEDQVDSSQYDPKDFTDAAETAGGKWSEADQAFMMPNGELQGATNTPTWDAGTNSYQGAQGQSLKPKAQFSLGGATQAERFTPDQISDYRNNRVADIYAESGDVDKAMGVRSQAQSMKLGKVQLEQADAAGKEANNVRKLMKIQAGLATGEIMPEDAIKQIIPITDKANGDGITHAYKMLEDGTFEITEHRNDKAVGSKIVNVGEAMKAALKYASPTMWAQMQTQENSDRTFKQSGDQFNTNVGLKREEMKTSGDQFQQKMDYQMVSDNEKRELDLQEIGIKNKVANAQIGYYGARENNVGSGKSQQIIGVSSDGKRILYNTPNGVIAEPMPEGVTAEDLFPKTTGLRPDKGMTVSDRLKLKEAVDAELENDPNIEALVKDPAALNYRKQQIKNQLLGIDDPITSATDYTAMAAEIEGDAAPTPTKTNWWDKPPMKPQVQNGQQVSIGGGAKGQIIPRGLQFK